MRLTLAIMLAAATLAACSTVPQPASFGERVSSEGGTLATLGKQWNEAERNIAKGRAMVSDGTKDVERGEDLIARGEKLVRDGKRAVSRGTDLVSDNQKVQKDVEAQYARRAASGT